MSIEEFAAQRDPILRTIADRLRPGVDAALASHDWYDLMQEMNRIFEEVYEAEGGPGDPSFSQGITILDSLERTHVTGKETQAERITTWLATAIVGAATDAAAQRQPGKGVQWVTMEDERVRPVHQEAHGQTRRSGQAFDIGGFQLQYPGQPVGPPEVWINCVVGSTKVAWPGQDVLALTRYVASGDFIDVRTVDGHLLTLTPNHPVLTPSGYVPAGRLSPGDQVMAAPLPEAPEVADGPPSIEQVYEAARVAGNVQRVGRSGVDFHGDVPDDEVEVVWADGDLAAQLRVQRGDAVLVGAGVGQGVLGVSGARQLTAHEGVPGRGGPSSTSSRVRSGRQITPLGRGEPGQAQSVGLAAAAAGQSEVGQAPLDDVAGDAEVARHLQHALAFGVSACEVVEVKRYQARHPVYNLHTTENYYFSNGIVAHNCRCVLRVVEIADAMVAAGEEGTTMSTTTPVEDEAPPIPDEDLALPIPWYGVLAPEGVWSGDRRRFAEGALRHRDLPLPLKYQATSDDGHRGSVVVGRIDRVWREGNEMRAEGVFDSNPHAYEAVRQIAEKMIRGVSVDVDDAEGEMADGSDDVPEGSLTFSSARISAATLVAIPAFAEAFVSLGFWEEPKEAGGGEFAISEEAWDGSAGRFTPEQWKRSCILHVCDGDEKSCHKLPIREPGGALSRRGVHAAAARINQVDAPSGKVAAAKRALASAYRQLGEEPPFAGATAEFDIPPRKTKDGPGWITHPSPTKEITAYWVDGVGRAKIGWGLPGDWRRCVAQLSKYVRNPEWTQGLCANLHYRALGTWPGQHRGAATAEVGAFGLLASAAPALEGAWVQGVGAGDVVAVSTDGSRNVSAAQVLRPGHRLQVIGPDTQPYTAEVVEVQARRDGAVLSLKGEDVRTGALPATVAVAVPSASPDNALALRPNEVVKLRVGSAVWGPVGTDAPVVALAHTQAWASAVGAVAQVCMDAFQIAHTTESTPQHPMVAAGGPPPKAWFTNPNLTGPTPMQVTEDGRVYGHLALWKTCHTAKGGCVRPPRSPSNYSYFHTGEILTDSGPVPVGQITMGGGHASLTLGVQAAAEHYDNVATAVADIVAGEDAHGIWFSGALRPSVTTDDVTALRAAALSGDWRNVDGEHELVAALAVNVPGFPIPRLSIVTAGAHGYALTAAGVVTEESVSEYLLEMAAKARTTLKVIKARRVLEDAHGMSMRGEEGTTQAVRRHHL